MAYERRSFSGSAIPTTVTSTMSSTDLTVFVGSTANWPTIATGPFYIVVDAATATEETMKVTAYTGTSATVTRAQRGTTAATHQVGANVYPCSTDQDFDEANQAVVNTIGKVTTAGDLLVASGANAFNRLAIGSNTQVLTVSGGVVAWAAVPSSGVTSFNGRTGAVVPVASDYTKTFRLSSTYAISGTVSNVTLPLFEVGLATGESKTMQKVVTKLSAGTATVQLTRNGTNLGSAISVTTTKLVTTLSQALSDGDDLAAVVSSASGASDLTVTIEIDAAA